MLWVSVSSQVTPRYPPVLSTDAVCKFGEAGHDAGFPLWKVYSGAESKPSLCSSGQGQWTGKAPASRSALESLQQGGVQTLSVLLQVGTVAS